MMGPTRPPAPQIIDPPREITGVGDDAPGVPQHLGDLGAQFG